MDAMLDEPITRPASTPGRSSSKGARSLSDPPSNNSNNTTLAPSPEFKERSRTRDDHAIPTTPRPRPPNSSPRPKFLSRGLTLELPPPRVSTGDVPAPSLSPFAVPLSPKPDSQYMGSPTLSHSPATALPRHSRGLDFSRACTNLHHSTIAEQSSPDSSPVITQRGVNIPGRKMSVGSMALDSPNVAGPSSLPWGMAHEKSTVSSSVGSVNMMGSESETTDSDEDASMGEDADDPMFTTPHVHKLQNPTAPTPPNVQSTPGGSAWGTGAHFSPAQASLMKTVRRNRLHKNGKRSRKSSSSASNSGYSSLASPRAQSPPAMRSIEPSTNGGYFSWTNTARSRRESLAMGTDGLNISSGNDSGDEASLTAPSTPGVVRRAVTRRGNLLPKTKGFARIRAALMEEAAPIDTDVRKEAETIRQVRERDTSVGELDLQQDRPQTATAASSPNLLPAVPESAQEDFGRELEGDKGLGMSFAAHATRNSGGMAYWNRFDPATRTPPPPNFARTSSSVMSDMMTDSPIGDFTQWRRPRARSSASDASEAFQPNSNGNGIPNGVSDDMHLQKFKKRQREDDSDIATIKRRAVSPGMSSQNSPVLTNSPVAKDSGIAWGQPPERREKNGESAQNSWPSSRSDRGGSVGMPSGGSLVSQGKKLGLQPMSDTNDGLMKMSIE